MILVYSAGLGGCEMVKSRLVRKIEGKLVVARVRNNPNIADNILICGDNRSNTVINC